MAIQLTFSQCKQIKRLPESLFSEPDFREVVENIAEGQTDFYVDDVRFISDEVILSVMAEELSSDLYCLGCFNAHFLAPHMGIDQDIIEALQEAEGFEQLGKLIIEMCDMENLAEEYAIADGFGHHFNSSDGNSEEITINNVLYHVFDNH